MPKSGPRPTYRYNREFKATTVRLSQLPAVAIKDVAESPCIHPFMLSLWRKHVREKVGAFGRASEAVAEQPTPCTIGSCLAASPTNTVELGPRR